MDLELGRAAGGSLRPKGRKEVPTGMKDREMFQVSDS